MCGIVGIWAKNIKGEESLPLIDNALKSLAHRGPDNSTSKIYSKVALGHTRLSIIDTTVAANQPMTDELDRYSLVFNGEIYNYKILRSDLESQGVVFKTASDTEVLLQLLIKYREKAVEKLNGFYAFVFYDSLQNEILFARDKMGIKPLIIYEDQDKIIICSELSVLSHFEVNQTIDADALNHYLGLTYIPASHTIFEQAFKIKPGHLGLVKDNFIDIRPFFALQRMPYNRLSFGESIAELREKLEKSVELRMISDVPLGCFLSGGLDSSIISSIAKKLNPNLETFSIGFDHSYFDESGHARSVAKHIKSNHNEFILTRNDFELEFENFLEAIDEPFADSSAFATYLLSKKTAEKVKVALSGDGADELFGGYNKHRALLKSMNMSKKDKLLVKVGAFLLGSASLNRSSKWGELNRKIQKMKTGLDLDIQARYWHWCHFSSIDAVVNILKDEHNRVIRWEGYGIQDMSDSLIADQQFVLPNDMLKKVDLMSMANSLEVRTPFLDLAVVNFANAIPLDFKMNTNTGKIILKEAFRDSLPPEILNRKKRGFEIPIQDWLGGEINRILNSELFKKDYIENQGVFKYEGVHALIKSSNRKDFGDNIYLLWALVVFQYWWNKYLLK